MAQTRYLTQLNSKRRPVEVDQLTHFDRLLFRTVLAFTPVNFTIIFFTYSHPERSTPRKGITIKNSYTQFWEELKMCVSQALFEIKILG